LIAGIEPACGGRRKAANDFGGRKLDRFFSIRDFFTASLCYAESRQFNFFNPLNLSPSSPFF